MYREFVHNLHKLNFAQIYEPLEREDGNSVFLKSHGWNISGAEHTWIWPTFEPEKANHHF